MYSRSCKREYVQFLQTPSRSEQVAVQIHSIQFGKKLSIHLKVLRIRHTEKKDKTFILIRSVRWIIEFLTEDEEKIVTPFTKINVFEGNISTI